MTAWTVYESGTGKIFCAMEGSRPIADELKGRMYVEGWGEYQKHYVENGAIIPRPVLSIIAPTNGKVNQDLIFSGIPDGCILLHPGGEATINGGSVEWQTPEPGLYEFEFRLFPFLNRVFSIEVTI